MLKYVAAEVAALICLAREKHAGRENALIATFVKLDIISSYKKHAHNALIAMREDSLPETRDFVYEYIRVGKTRSCPECAARWGALVAFEMCDRIVGNDTDLSLFEQYALGIYLEGCVSETPADLPVCNHDRTQPICENFLTVA